MSAGLCQYFHCKIEKMIWQDLVGNIGHFTLSVCWKCDHDLNGAGHDVSREFHEESQELKPKCIHKTTVIEFLFAFLSVLPWARHKDWWLSYASDPGGRQIFVCKCSSEYKTEFCIHFSQQNIVFTFWFKKTKYIWKKTNTIWRLDLKEIVKVLTFTNHFVLAVQ